MQPQIANLVFAVGISGLFWLARDRRACTSKALWIPSLWLIITGSRPVSVWLGLGQRIDSPEKYLDGSPLDALFFGALLTAGVVVLVGRRMDFTMLRANWPILLFFSYCALSTLWSDYTFVALKRWTKSVGDVVMVLIILTDPDPPLALKRLLSRAAFLLVPLSVLFIKYYPDLGREYDVWSGVPMYCGVTLFKNLLGMTCLICGLGSLWSFLAACRDRKGRERSRRLIAQGAVLLMVFWLFWVADSMTSLACFILAGGLMVTTSLFRPARKPEVVTVLVLTAICVPLAALFSDMGGGMVGSLGRDPTLTGRTEIWKVVLSLVENSLVGTGFESFWAGDRILKVWKGLNAPGIQEAHNGYLEVYLNLGWIGVTLLAVLIATGYRNVVQALRRNAEVGGLKLAFFVTGVIYSFTEAGFRMMAPVWIAFLIAISASPEAAILEASPALDIKCTGNLAGSDPERDHVFAGFRKETF